MSTPATVVISESNGAGPTVTDGITGLSFGSADIPNMVAADHPLVIPVAGFVYSYNKETRWKVTAWVDTTTIDNLKWFKSAGTNAANWQEQQNSAGAAYVTPVRTSQGNDATWPTAAGSAVPLAGTISNPTIGYPSGTNYNLMQLRIASTTVAGAKGSHTLTFRYDES